LSRAATITFQERCAAAGGRHRCRRVAEGQTHHARRCNGIEVQGGNAEVVAVRHADERDAELARPLDRRVDGERARGKREPRLCIDEHRATAGGDDGRHGTAVRASVREVRRVLRHA
jgi:hypothetical protein